MTVVLHHPPHHLSRLPFPFFQVRLGDLELPAQPEHIPLLRRQRRDQVRGQ